MAPDSMEILNKTTNIPRKGQKEVPRLGTKNDGFPGPPGWDVIVARSGLRYVMLPIYFNTLPCVLGQGANLTEAQLTASALPPE